ncbi:DNA polymerase iota [Eumeta japonica]|uniref:DNA polymerase iota n=1 Tax=Eumeta variegata TaxID=151549 RepID=A0A4C1YG54_EUMVA|nr:DNA polymerase iota [Eumeta japonica]
MSPIAGALDSIQGEAQTYFRTLLPTIAATVFKLLNLKPPDEVCQLAAPLTQGFDYYDCKSIIAANSQQLESTMIKEREANKKNDFSIGGSSNDEGNGDDFYSTVIQSQENRLMDAIKLCNQNVDVEHPKIIIHIDIDCFYAQVEMLKNPELRNAPLGVQQKNIVVTSNYEARRYGIEKCMLVTDALKMCPSLKLVYGEDLHDYRVASNKIFLLLQSWKCPVEKLGMDENFVDVTNLVQERLKTTESNRITLVGHLFGESIAECPCSCHIRLKLASQIASEIRQKIFEELGFTSCAGISHNKLLSKLVCPLFKPNDQTTIFPESATQFMSTLNSVRCIPSIGSKTTETLISLNIKTVYDLQEVSLDVLKRHFSSDMAVRLKSLSFGEDNTPVKQSGKPQSIGLEDSFRTVSLKSEVEEKFATLLQRLLLLVREDGRIPVSLRVTLRKKDARRVSSHRESRQCQISSSIFTLSNGIITVTENGQSKLMSIIMRLFNKLVDMAKPFHLTLVGLAFTKFQERMTGRSSIVNYLMNDISVQSVLNIQNDCDTSASSMDYSAVSPSSSTTTDLSDAEVEPSPKKPKKVTWIAKRRCLSKEDVASPSKLRVGELRLNSRELEKVSELRLNSRDRSVTPRASPAKDNLSDTSDCMKDIAENSNCEECPSYVDKEVFHSLPDDMQQELKVMWKNPSSSEMTRSHQKSANKTKSNTLLKYFVPQK